MDATPSNTGQYGAGGDMPPASVLPQLGQGTTSAMGGKWSALHDAAAAVGAIAGLASEPMTPEARNFPALMRGAGGWRRALAEQGIEDLAAIMEPGLSALLSARAQGVNPTAAARALWHEFRAARDALLALAPPPER
jgi:hypothetical protein